MLLDRLSLNTISPVQTLSTLYQMPLATSLLLFGHDGDFHTLIALLKVGRTAVIATGISGMGKTKFLVRVAHRYDTYLVGELF